ncbi:MAG: DNA alkylation repair protein [Deltaproteobacteria bacterium]|nr:DNA alkylation repair protein [Deltaproteobacteria bacterium]
MGEPFKKQINTQYVLALGTLLKERKTDFDLVGFLQYLKGKLLKLELKGRVALVSEALGCYLTGPLKVNADILSEIMINFQGILGWPLNDYVSQRGLGSFANFSCAMDFFARTTEYSSAEFAVRPLIEKDPERALSFISKWAKDSNLHLRRLASEGIRPRLPWAPSLKLFCKDPRPVLKIIELLIYDKVKYVQKSLANSLNDISKDNPEVFLDFCAKWLQKDPSLRPILERGARTLLKNKDKKAISVFSLEADFKKVKVLKAQLKANSRNVVRGSELTISYKISLDPSFKGPVRLQYALGYPMAKGKLGEKVYLLKSTVASGATEIKGERRISFKDNVPIKQRAGRYTLSLLANGHRLDGATISFTLTS